MVDLSQKIPGGKIVRESQRKALLIHARKEGVAVEFWVRPRHAVDMGSMDRFNLWVSEEAVEKFDLAIKQRKEELREEKAFR